MSFSTTIVLPRPTRGSVIIERVKQVVAVGQATYSDRRFVEAEEPQRPGKLLVGQASDRGRDHIRVQPHADTEAFDPNVEYSQVVILSKPWPRWIHIIENSRQRMSGLREFSDLLEKYLA